MAFKFIRCTTLIKPLSILLSAAFFFNCSLTLNSAQAGSTLQIVTENLPPLNYQENSAVTGFSTELIQAICRQAGIKPEIQILPWARAYQNALNTPNTLIYSIVRTPEREALFHWIGPFKSRLIHIYKLRERSDIKIRTIDDLSHYKLGLVREMASNQILTQHPILPKLQIDYAPSQESNIKKLFAKRIDLIVALDWSAAYLSKTQNRTADELEAVFLVDDKKHYYFALNKQSDPALLKTLEQAFQKVNKSDLPDKLTLKYLH